VRSLTVEKVIHINQVLGDFEGANRFYQRVFDAAEYMNNFDPGERRDASLFLVGDTCIELFSPRDGESLLGANLARYGDSFHSFELKVPDLEAARAAFEDHGVRITTYRPGSFFMVHPKDAHGLLFEVCPHEMGGDLRLEPGWSPERWRTGPLGIRRLNALTAAVRDVDAASAFLSSLLGAAPLHEGEREGVGRIACFWLGDTVLEIAEPSAGDGPVAAYIEQYGPRMLSLVWQVADVEAAATHLAGQGVRVVPGDLEGWIAIDPRDNYGVLWQFTEDAQPGDPRG
jgi:catechol 2,3-dioxygenase-like lactoylglutathione lyase family enzyme